MGWTVERARHELVRLAHRGFDRARFWREAAEIVGRVVPFDGGCWHTLDPATLLITSHHTNLSGEGFALICRNEYLADDANKFAALAGTARPVGLLTREHGGPESMRFREVYRPRGWGSELRASFDLGGSTWGSAMLLRERGREDFAERDARILARLAPRVAHGIRAGLLLQAAATSAEEEEGPGVVVLDGDDADATPPAARWLEELEPDGGRLPASVLAIAARVRAAADPPARSRVRTRSGRWLVLHGSRLGNRVAVVLEPAVPSQVAPLLVAAYGLTARERDVLRDTLRGLPTKTIAARLNVTPYTVQDHLKSIFEKTGVRTRGELAGRLFYEHYAPRVAAEAPLAADGWFA